MAGGRASALGGGVADKLGNRYEGRHLGEGTEVVLASSRSCVLSDLSDKARRLCLGDWLATLTAAEDGSIVEPLTEAWETDRARVHDRLQRFFFHGITDHSLRDATMDGLRTQVSGDPEGALRVLGDLLVERLSARLTAQSCGRPCGRRGMVHEMGTTMRWW